MSGFPRPREPQQAHSLIATPPIQASPSGNGSGKCALIGVVLLLAIAAVAFLGNAKLSEVSRDATKAKDASDAALKVATDQRDSNAGLLQSIGQTLTNLKASGLLTPEQLSAIAAGIQSNQAAQGGAKAQAGTTPGIPGSRSGGGTSVTPGVPGSATAKPVASQTTPPPHSSDTSKCLLTVDVAQVLKLDGTVCPH
jgi:hypothetical protein